MFRGSSYSINTDNNDSSFAHLPEQSIKIALVGVSSVGKSCIINCIERDRFNEDIEPTQGYQIRFKKLRINNHLINLTVWDGNGDKMLQFIKEKRLAQFDGILYIFDLTDPKSMIDLEQLHYEIKQNYKEEFSCLLVGNKADLLTAVKDLKTQQQKIPETNEAHYLALKFEARTKMLYIDVSAKMNHCVTDCFVLIIKEILSSKRFIHTSRFEEEIEEKLIGNKCNIFSSCNCEIM